MISFILAIVALILGYAFYSKFVEKVFGIEPDSHLQANITMVWTMWKLALQKHF